jgi:sirohydrochlorin cobaltochelatase
VSASVQETALANWLAAGLRCIGQISIDREKGAAFVLVHRDDILRNGLLHYERAEDASEIARFDDAGNYRPLKTAPNLQHGWRLVLQDVAALRIALDLFYPGRLAAFFAWEQAALAATPLRTTLERQTGMYRASAKISDDQVDTLVGNFCRSEGGCLRTILWKRDESGAVASTRLPSAKFDPPHDQTGLGAPVIPLLCQEACNLLVAEARKIVRDFA